MATKEEAKSGRVSFHLRLSKEMRDRIQSLATKNCRSLSAEIEYRLIEASSEWEDSQ